jgi:Holliday junction resolvasome RuvABC endonuclease subunit
VSALEELRLRHGFDAPGPAPEGSWRPLEAGALAPGTVLGFDPSLRATGWALVRSDERGVWVAAVGKLTTEPPSGKVTWEDRIADSVSIHHQALQVLRSALAGTPGLVVHREKPPTGPDVRDPYSSALAGAAVEIACSELGVPTSSVSPQSVKYLLTGRRGGDKKPIKAALTAMHWLGGRALLTNDATRDGAAIALHRLATGEA